MKRKNLPESKDNEQLYSVLETAYKLLGNPIALFDTSYNLLWNPPNVVTDDPLWNELVSLGCFSQKSVDFFSEEGFINASALSETVSVMKSPRLKYDRLNCKLFDKDDVQLANIILVGAFKPLGSSDEKLLDVLCGVIANKLQNSSLYKKIDRVYNKTIIGEIIDGNIKKGKISAQRLEELYEGLKSNLYVAVVDITEYEHTVTHLAYFRDIFKRLMPEYKYFVHSNYVVIIIGVERFIKVKQHMAKLIEFFEDHNLYAGISSVFSDLTDIRHYYQEAINAINYGQKSGREENVFLYDDYRLECYLKLKGNYRDMYYPLVEIIKEYAAKHNPHLIKELSAYLAYGMNIDKTASLLDISPEDLSRDLNSLTDLFGVDYLNGDMLTSLYITLKMQNEG